MTIRTKRRKALGCVGAMLAYAAFWATLGGLWVLADYLFPWMQHLDESSRDMVFIGYLMAVGGFVTLVDRLIFWFKHREEVPGVSGLWSVLRDPDQLAWDLHRKDQEDLLAGR